MLKKKDWKKNNLKVEEKKREGKKSRGKTKMTTVGDWMLKDQNCCAIVLIIFALIFLLISFLTFRHFRTMIFCLLAVFACCGAACSKLEKKTQKSFFFKKKEEVSYTHQNSFYFCMIVAAVEKAIEHQRTYNLETCFSVNKCTTFKAVLQQLYLIFKDVDHVLFEGALHTFMSKEQIPFQIQETDTGPAGLTVYTPKTGMCVYIHSKGWINSFPAMVGGTLCTSSSQCIIKIFLHEIIHIVLFCIYLELNFSSEEIQTFVHSHFDHTHNVLFTAWLRFFFGQITIDNSLLLTETTKEPLVFKRTILETEKNCLLKSNEKDDKQLKLLYHGMWQPVQYVKQHPTKPHYSYVSLLTTSHHYHHHQQQQLLVPNGLLSC